MSKQPTVTDLIHLFVSAIETQETELQRNALVQFATTLSHQAKLYGRVNNDNADELFISQAKAWQHLFNFIQYHYHQIKKSNTALANQLKCYFVFIERVDLTQFDWLTLYSRITLPNSNNTQETEIAPTDLGMSSQGVATRFNREEKQEQTRITQPLITQHAVRVLIYALNGYTYPQHLEQAHQDQLTNLILLERNLNYFDQQKWGHILISDQDSNPHIVTDDCSARKVLVPLLAEVLQQMRFRLTTKNAIAWSRETVSRIYEQLIGYYNLTLATVPLGKRLKEDKQQHKIQLSFDFYHYKSSTTNFYNSLPMSFHWRATRRKYHSQLKYIWQPHSQGVSATIKQYVVNFAMAGFTIFTVLLLISFIMALVTGGATTPLIAVLSWFKGANLLAAYQATAPWLMVVFNIVFCAVLSFGSLIVEKLVLDFVRFVSASIETICELGFAYVKHDTLNLSRFFLITFGTIFYVLFYHPAKVLYQAANFLDWAPHFAIHQVKSTFSDDINIGEIFEDAKDSAAKQWSSYLASAITLSIVAFITVVALGASNLSLLCLLLQTLHAKSLLIALHSLHPLAIFGIDLAAALVSGFILLPAIGIFLSFIGFIARAGEKLSLMDEDDKPDKYNMRKLNNIWKFKKIISHKFLWAIKFTFKYLFFSISYIARLLEQGLQMIGVIGLLILEPLRYFTRETSKSKVVDSVDVAFAPEITFQSKVKVAQLLAESPQYDVGETTHERDNENQSELTVSDEECSALDKERTASNILRNAQMIELFKSNPIGFATNLILNDIGLHFVIRTLKLMQYNGLIVYIPDDYKNFESEYHKKTQLSIGCYESLQGFHKYHSRQCKHYAMDSLQINRSQRNIVKNFLIAQLEKNTAFFVIACKMYITKFDALKKDNLKLGYNQFYDTFVDTVIQMALLEYRFKNQTAVLSQLPASKVENVPVASNIMPEVEVACAKTDFSYTHRTL